MSTPTSVEQLANEALTRIGYPESIGNIYEGTKQARAALDIYAQTRDALLRQFDYDFSERIITAVVSANAPPPPWDFAYDYPADCLKLRSLFAASYLADKNDPMPVNWTIAYDPTGAVKAIFANVDAAHLVYTFQATNMVQWEPLFTEALIDAMARRLTPLLEEQMLKPTSDQEINAIAGAAGTMG